jgi:pilus assembly protein FimV
VLAATAPLPGPLQAREDPLELDLSDPEGLGLGVGLGLKHPPPHPDQEPLADLDLDLGDLLDLDRDLELGPGVTPSPRPAREATGLDLDFDYDLTLGPEQSAGPSIEGSSGLGGMALGEALAMDAPKTGTNPLSRDGKMSTLAVDSTADFEPADDSWHEVGIKLELARAYLRMDDPEAALPLLAEAIAEGAEEQVAAAKAMLSRLK